MWNWWTLSTTPAKKHITCSPLRLEELETREVPAVLIQIDYSLDTGFFSNNPAARAVMEQVATELGNSISGNLPAVTPAGGNTWSATFFNPATGTLLTVPNMAVGAGAIKVFVGGRALGGSEAGFAGTSGFSASGTSDWVNSVQGREWGGSIAFDTTRNWFYGQTTTGLTSSQLDFYSVALHEMGHVLGLGLSSTWNSLSSGGYFHGANAEAVYGGPVPLAPDGDHWADGITVGGQQVSMDPVLMTGTRVKWSSLDTAALRDLGWGATDVGAAAATVAAPVVNTQPIVVSSGGSVSLAAANNTSVTPTGAQFTPFVGYTGTIHIATADFNGDGVTDYAFATGPGPQSVVEVINGRDGRFLANQTVLFPGYSGGFEIAAGDIDGDGKAELVVALSNGVPPIVQTYRASNGLQLQSNFVAFDASWFGGGLHVAVGDINRDGFADVVVTSASQVGAVAIYSGAELRDGRPTYLFDPFVALPGSPLGLNVAVGDMDGDGYADLALTFAQGGPAFVAIWSGATLTQNPKTPVNQIAPAEVFLALSPDDLSGARLAMRDIDGDGRADLLVASSSAQAPVVRVFSDSLSMGGMYLDPSTGNAPVMDVA